MMQASACKQTIGILWEGVGSRAWRALACLWLCCAVLRPAASCDVCLGRVAPAVAQRTLECPVSFRRAYICLHVGQHTQALLSESLLLTVLRIHSW